MYLDVSTSLLTISFLIHIEGSENNDRFSFCYKVYSGVNDTVRIHWRLNGIDELPGSWGDMEILSGSYNRFML